jgi:hypothetical protein
MLQLVTRLQEWLDLNRKVDFFGPLALRLYQVPVFWAACHAAGAVLYWRRKTERRPRRRQFPEQAVNIIPFACRASIARRLKQWPLASNNFITHQVIFK